MNECRARNKDDLRHICPCWSQSVARDCKPTALREKHYWQNIMAQQKMIWSVNLEKWSENACYLQLWSVKLLHTFNSLHPSNSSLPLHFSTTSTSPPPPLPPPLLHFPHPSNSPPPHLSYLQMYTSVLVLEDLDRKAHLVNEEEEEKSELLKRKEVMADKTFALLRLKSNREANTK